MFFSSEYWLISLLWAVIAAAVSAGVAYVGGNETIEGGWNREAKTTSANKRSLVAGAIGFVVALLCMRFLMYYIQPVFQGTFFGYWPVLVASLVPAFATGMIVNGHRSKRGWIATTVTALALTVVPVTQYGFNAWGPDNAARHAALPKIRIAGPEEKIPPTDPDRMVLVTRSIAIFKGQTALSTEPGVASRYTINHDTYTLQYVGGHRYWIAPLTPVNTGDTFWTPLFGGMAHSPGYVVVDAENPSKDAWLKLGFEISVFVDQRWSMNLSRWVYQQGYRDGTLDSPIFEVDDNWQPYYTIGYVRKAFGDVSGNNLEKVLAVNVSKAKPVLEEHAVDKKPEWVDRVISKELVKEWATDWGWYGGEYARDNHWSVVFNVNRTGTMAPADYELAYTKDHHNVWVVPMTSTFENDHTVVGVLVFESGKNEATFYPGIKGFNEPESVDETMVNARDNIKHYPVESVQLYTIFGEQTWVAIYASPQSIGKSFGGIGILHAHSQDAADVVFATDKQTALRLYAQQLARRGAGSDESISQTVQQSKEITGRIQRIAPLPTSGLGGSPTYMFVLAGDSRTYVVTRDAYARIPLVKEGDEVSFTYLDTNTSETAVNTFKCKALDANAPEAAPAK